MLNYEVYTGTNNRWVVFLHGIGGSVKTWKKQLDAFKEYNVILIDLPGHGKSKSDKHITIPAVNEYIKEVLDHFHISKVDIVALSLGTLVAIHFALKYPERVNSLVLGGSIINIDGMYKNAMKFTYACKKIVPYKFLYRILAKVILPKRNHKRSRMIFIRESLHMSREMFFSWLKYTMQILHSEEIIAKLKTLKVKLCFISGSEDRCFLSGTARCVRELENSTFRVIKNCGHVCSIERANEFNALALDFLAQPA